MPSMIASSGETRGPAAPVLDLERGEQRGGLDDLRLALAAGGLAVRVIFEERVWVADEIANRLGRNRDTIWPLHANREQLAMTGEG